LIIYNNEDEGKLARAVGHSLEYPLCVATSAKGITITCLFYYSVSSERNNGQNV